IVDDPTSKGSKRKTPEETARISIPIPKKGVMPPPKVTRQLLSQTLLGKRGRQEAVLGVLSSKVGVLKFPRLGVTWWPRRMLRW
ncbi:hypothetical protein A2U01_0079654, partial [Trifolium medium]|nr:hypothetical protein [Trifolium medium]